MNRRNRRSIRLPGYDYSQPGGYFLTLCAQDRRCLFGAVVAGVVELSPAGESVLSTWKSLPEHYLQVDLDALVIMPNHVHGILLLRDSPGNRHKLAEIVRALKTFSARKINRWLETPGAAVWQRGYYERVIRNEGELRELRRYIAENPLKWELDPENPEKRASGRS